MQQMQADGGVVGPADLGILSRAAHPQFLECHREGLARDKDTRLVPMRKRRSRAQPEDTPCRAQPLLAPGHRGRAQRQFSGSSAMALHAAAVACLVSPFRWSTNARVLHASPEAGVNVHAVRAWRMP